MPKLLYNVRLWERVLKYCLVVKQLESVKHGNYKAINDRDWYYYFTLELVEFLYQRVINRLKNYKIAW